MRYPFASLWRLRRAPVAAAAMIALWCAAGTAAASENGTFELVTSFVRNYVTFDHAGGTVTGWHLARDVDRHGEQRRSLRGGRE